MALTPSFDVSSPRKTKRTQRALSLRWPYSIACSSGQTLSLALHCNHNQVSKNKIYKTTKDTKEISYIWCQNLRQPTIIYLYTCIILDLKLCVSTDPAISHWIGFKKTTDLKSKLARHLIRHICVQGEDERFQHIWWKGCFRFKMRKHQHVA